MCVSGSIPLVPTITKINMQMEISKTDFEKMMSLIDKACTIIKSGNPKPKEYNVARQLYLIKKKLERKNGKV